MICHAYGICSCVVYMIPPTCTPTTTEDWDVVHEGFDHHVLGGSDEDDFPSVFPHGDVDLSFTETHAGDHLHTAVAAQQQVSTRP